MRKLKKLRMWLLLILLSLSILVTFGGFKSSAASSGTVTFHYSVYSKSTWLSYVTAMNNESFMVGEDLKVSTAWDANSIIEALEDYEANPNYVNWIDDWGIPIPFYLSSDLETNSDGSYVITGKGTRQQYVAKADATPHEGNSATVYATLRSAFPSKDLSTYPTITQAVPGDEIVVAVNAEVSATDTIRQAVIALDLERYAQGGTLTGYHADLFQDMSAYTLNKQLLSKVGQIVGWTANSGVSQPNPAFVGAVGFTVATGVTGNMKIEYLKKERAVQAGYAQSKAGQTMFMDGNDGSTSSDAYQNPTQILEDNCVISVAGLSDDVGLTDITVEGKSCLSTSSSVNVNGDATLQYKGSDTNDGTANVSITVQNSGKLVANSVKYGKTLSSQTSSATQSGNSFSVNMNALNAGESYIATFQVESSSGNVRKWYAVELPKAKDTNCDLDSLGFSGTNGGSTADIRLSPDFSSSTTSYTMYIPKGTTNLKLTPSVNSNLKTIKAAYPATGSGTTVASGADFNIPTWTNNSAVKFTVTAQSGATKDYTVTLKELNLKPTSVTVTASASFNESDTDADNDNRFAINGMPYSNSTFSLQAIFPDTSVIDRVDVYQGSVKSPSNILNGKINFTISNTGDKGAHTEVIRLEVYAKSGNKQIYYVDVNRLAANTDHSLGTVNIVANNGLNSTICNSFSGTNLTINYPGGASMLPMAYTGFTVTATPSNPLSTVEIKINNNVQSTFSFTGATEARIPVSIKITAEDGTSQTYNGMVIRAGANDDRTFTIVETNYSYTDENGDPRNGTYTLSDIGSNTWSNPNNLMPFLTKTATFKIVPNTSTTKVYIGGIDYTNKVFTTTFTNNKTNHKQRVKVLIKSEYDEVTRPNNPESGGLEFWIDLECEAPDDTMDLTNVELLHATSGAVISDTSNTQVSGRTYTYVLKESVVGSSFKLNLEWLSNTTKAYVSLVNDSTTEIKPTNVYSPHKTWSIGVKVYVFLQSQAENNLVYIIDTKFADERSTENGIANVVFKNGNVPLNFTFNETQTTYPSSGTIKVPFSVTSLDVEITAKHAKETLAAGINFISSGIDTNLKAYQTVNLQQGNNVFKVQGVAENGQAGKIYTFNIERESGSTSNKIESLVINSINCADASFLTQYFDYVFNSLDTNFSFYLPRGTSYLNVELGVSLNASFTITSSKGDPTSTSPFYCNVTDGEVVVLTINVKSETETITGTGSGKTYTIRVYIADTDNKLDNLNIYVSQDELDDILDENGNTFNFDSNTANLGTFTVPFKTKGAFFLPSKDGFFGTIAFDGQTLGQASDGYEKSFNKAGSYKITVKVTSELGNLAKNDAKINKTDKSFTYTFTVVRKEGSNNNYLTSLEIYIDGLKKDYTINGVAQPFLKTNTGPYMVENVKAVSPDANIVAVKEDESATVTGDGIQTIALPDGTISQLFVIRVTAEDEVSVRDYKIQLWTTKANPSTDKALNRITATSDTDGKTNKLTPTFTQNIHQYTINLSSVEEEAILHFTKNSSDSTLYIDDGLNNVATTDTSYDYSVSISPNSSVVVTVYLTAQDGSEGDPYEITISRDAADTDATLDQFTINGKPVTGFTSGDNGGQYEVHIGDANEVYFDGVPKKSTTTISRNPAPSNDRQPLNIGSNIFTVETTAQDGKTTCRYTVNVIKDAPRILDELEALVENTNKLTPTFAPEIYRGYSVSLTFDQTSAIIKYVSQHVTAGHNTVSVFDPQGNEITSANNLITITNIAVGSTVYKVRVKTESGATADYEITFVRDAGSDDNSIIQYEYLANTGDSSYTNLTVNGVDTSYKYTVGRDITTFDPRITTSDPNAKIIMPTDLTLTPGKANIKRVIIESQTGKQKIYTFTVYPCDTDFDIDDINALVSLGGADILDIDGTKFIDYENGNLSITVANSIAQTYLEVLGGGANSVIYVNGNKYTNQIVTLKEGTNTFVIYIKSEYGEADPAATNAQSPSVTITITRQAKSTDSTLKELTVTYVDSAGVEHTVEHLSLPGNSVLAIPNIGENVTVVNISATPTDPTSTVLGTGQRDLNDKEQAIFNFTVKCTAEDGSSTDYPIKIARGPIDVDKDNSLTYIEVSDGTGTIHLGQDSFNANTTSYGTYHIPFEAQNYTITVVKPGYSPSIVLIDNQTVMSGTRTTTILDSDRGKTKTVKVQVQAQDGTKGQEYTIELEFDAPSQNASLSDLTADGVTVPGFTPEDQGGTYTLSPRSYDTETIEIGYKTSDSKATVVGDIGTQKLIEGVNTFVIVVTSESGTAYTYRIVVQRDYRAPYLTDLGAVGEKLLDTSYKNTTFDKEVFEYTTIVTYMTLHATINAAIDNETYTVSCSNSTAITTTGLLRSFNVDLAEGLNRFTITVTSLEGKTTEYVLTIKRRGEDSTNTDVASIEIKQIDQFKTEYTNDLREYAYQVPNGIRNLDFIVHPEKLADSNGDGATYKIINDKNLRVGHNTVVVLIIAEDMVSTRAILVDVERLPMNYTVDTEAYEKFECTATEQSTVYEIDLGDKRASAIEDYTKYIKFDQEHYDTSNQYVEEPTVTVISDIADENCREVVVSIYDGSEEQFVTFKLKSTALNTGYSIPEILQQIMPWILLAIAIIILIIILICVNRDKYGAINKKRKKDQD